MNVKYNLFHFVPENCDFLDFCVLKMYIFTKTVEYTS